MKKLVSCLMILIVILMMFTVVYGETQYTLKKVEVTQSNNYRKVEININDEYVTSNQYEDYIEYANILKVWFEDNQILDIKNDKCKIKVRAWEWGKLLPTTLYNKVEKIEPGVNNITFVKTKPGRNDDIITLINGYFIIEGLETTPIPSEEITPTPTPSETITPSNDPITISPTPTESEEILTTPSNLESNEPLTSNEPLATNEPTSLNKTYLASKELPQTGESDPFIFILSGLLLFFSGGYMAIRHHLSSKQK